MPFIHVRILEGTTEEQKDELVKEITGAFQRVTGASPDRVFIFFEDLKKENYGRYGSLLSRQQGG